MADELLASYRFREERQARWQALEALIERAERKGLASLQADELLEIPLLYRACASSLSVARSISLDANLVAYLENLVARAYFVVYGVRTGPGTMAARFVGRELPAAVRATCWSILFSAVLLFASTAAGWAITAADAAWFETFVSADMAQGRTPSASREDLAETLFDSPPPAEQLATFASFLFHHNARIGIMCFALGAAFGVPVVLLLTYNGLVVGAMCAVFAGKGLTFEFLAWLSIHGTTELFAVVICGGAGLHLANAMIDPGRHSRLAALKMHGRRAAILAVGAVGMLFVAALIEAFGRQWVVDTGARFAIGGLMLVAWCVYFAACGRGGRRARDGG